MKVRRLLAASGGLRPPARRRHPRHLSGSDREEISRGIAAGWTARRIATQLSRSTSTVSREIARNGGRDAYRAQAADVAAWRRARRPKATRLGADPELCELVRSKLSEDWSPQQITAWLRRTHPDDSGKRVSHETIYRTVFHAERRELGSKPWQHLRSGRSVRHPRGALRTGHGRGRLKNMVSIRDRPASVADRVEVGHWEGDLVMGRRPSAVATLVERSTRYVRVVALPDGYKADAVRRALTADLAQLPPSLRRSLTWDRGREMAEHEQLATDLGLQVFFCDPKSPWQRGSNENTNRLLRQYLAKGADLSAHTVSQLEKWAGRINRRPRRVLDWDTAATRFSAHLAADSGGA
ncbi:IS30 family transposase [Auraticoccus monumenti]|uniref:IS30 family transposase n=1 Tax=Auraticoccus monumenti TaxID=675864 RepID=UPI002F913FA7